MILKGKQNSPKKPRKSANIAVPHDFSFHGFCRSDFFPYICARRTVYF